MNQPIEVSMTVNDRGTVVTRGIDDPDFDAKIERIKEVIDKERKPSVREVEREIGLTVAQVAAIAEVLEINTDTVSKIVLVPFKAYITELDSSPKIV